MISNKNVFYDELLTFWKKPRYPSFIPSLQPIITWLLKFFGNKIKILKRGKSYFKMGQLRQPFILRWGKRYFKKGQGQFISKWVSYFKWRKILFQSAVLTSKWGVTQSLNY